MPNAETSSFCLKSSSAGKFRNTDPLEQDNHKSTLSVPKQTTWRNKKRNPGSPAGEEGSSKIAGAPLWRGGLLLSLPVFED